MKIFINEIQIDILYKLLTEEKYDAVAKGVKPGDVLKIVDKNNDEIKFSVVSNDGGRLYLKSAIKGNIYSNDFFFKDLSDIDNNSMELKRINTPAEFRNIDDDSERLKKVLNKYPIDTWKKFTFKTIKQLYLNDIDIDINDKQAQQQAQQGPTGAKDVKNYTPVTDPGEVGDLLSDFKAFKEGSDYKFTLIDGGVINTNLFDNKGGSLNFKVKSLNGSATKYTDLENADIRLDVNANNIKKYEYYDKDTDETSTYYDITFKSVLGGSGPGSERPVTVKYVTDINITKKETPDIDDMSNEDITDRVLNDPTFKSAFRQDKSLLSQFLTGKVTPDGIIKARNILKKYFNQYDVETDPKKLKKLSDKFKKGQLYIIKITDMDFKYGSIELLKDRTYGIGSEKIVGDKKTDTNGIPIAYLKGNGFTIKIDKQIDKNKYKGTIITSDGHEEQRTFSINYKRKQD